MSSAIHRTMTMLIVSIFAEAEYLHQTKTSSGPIEVCQWKTFNESCPPGSVIVIEHALYGRMRIGGCVDQAFGHQGCSVSVLSYVERKCAGKRQCQLSLPDAYLDQLVIPCPKDLKSYLEVSYHCVEVEMGEGQPCRGFEVVKATKSKGYLSNFVTEESNRGSVTCPWVIQGHPGQRFTITLIDFGVWMEDGDPSRVPVKSGLCHIYANIHESTGSHSKIVVCGGEHREQPVYTSETNVVHVEVTNPKSSANPTYFLLKYEIIGCADYVAPWSGVMVERHSDRTVIRCPNDHVTWELRCEADQWIGRHENCSEEWSAGSIWNIGGILSTSGTLPRNFVAMVISTIAVLVALGILIIGILFIRRRRGKRRQRRRQKLSSRDGAGVGAMADLDGKSTYDPTYIRYKEQYPMLLKADGFSVGVARGRESDYTATLPSHAVQPKPTTVHVTMGSSRLPHDPPDTAPDFYCFPADGTFPTDQDQDHYSLSSCASPQKDEEHIYESPKFFHRPHDDDDDDDAAGRLHHGSMYHELDHQAFTTR